MPSETRLHAERVKCLIDSIGAVKSPVYALTCGTVAHATIIIDIACTLAEVARARRSIELELIDGMIDIAADAFRMILHNGASTVDVADRKAWMDDTMRISRLICPERFSGD